jgi:hypothetical protein
MDGLRLQTCFQRLLKFSKLLLIFNKTNMKPHENVFVLLQVDRVSITASSNADTLIPTVAASIWAEALSNGQPPDTDTSLLIAQAIAPVSANSTGPLIAPVQYDWMFAPTLLAPGSYTARFTIASVSGLLFYYAGANCQGTDKQAEPIEILFGYFRPS